MTPRVAIFDSVQLRRESLARALPAAGVEVVATAATPGELVAALEAAQPELALLDLEENYGLLRSLREKQPAVRALVLADEGDLARAERSHREGASGYLQRRSLSVEALGEAIRAAARGEPQFPWGAAAPPAPGSLADLRLHRLTTREREVLGLVGAGHDNLKIAALLAISERTVKSHVIALYRKLQAENRVQLALIASQLGLAPQRG